MFLLLSWNRIWIILDVEEVLLDWPAVRAEAGQAEAVQPAAVQNGARKTGINSL